MKFRLLSILLFCSLISIAQQKDEDLNLQKNQILIQHDDTNKVLKLIKIGKEYSSINNDTALVLFETAHQISLKLGYKRGEVRSKQKIGNAYYAQNNLLKAEGFLKEAEEIAIENDFKKLIAIIFRGKAALQHERGRFEEGVLLLKKALHFHKEMNDSTNITSILNRISVFYRESKDIDSALFYNKQAIAASIVLNNKILTGRSYRNLAIIYTITNELNKAESFFIKALEIQSIYSREKELLFTKYQYGILLLKQKKYDLAIDILNTCNERTRKIGILKQLPHIYEKLSLAYSGNRQYKEAYQSAIEFHNLSEMLRYEKENQREIEENKNKIITQRKKAIMLEEEIKIESEFRKKQYLLIFALLIALLISIFLSRISKNKTIKYLIEKQKTEAAKALINEQEQVREDIAQELHDGIGGSLAALKLNISKIQQENDCPMLIKELQHLDKTYQEIRSISHNLTPVSFQKQSLELTLEDYIRRAFPNKETEAYFHCYPEKEISNLSYDQKICIYRIIQELVTNIQKHAKASNINVSLIGHKDHVTIMVEDNGIGFNNNNNGGIGFKNIKKRTTLYDGRLEIDSTLNKGTTIIIDLPYKNPVS